MERECTTCRGQLAPLFPAPTDFGPLRRPLRLRRADLNSRVCASHVRPIRTGFIQVSLNKSWALLEGA